jgi:formylglycine-generating enzyme
LQWAKSQGYHFQNDGNEGSDGSEGLKPTSRMYEPVTGISWRDVVVWANALSDILDLDPVYRSSSGHIIKDSRDSNANIVDAAVQTDTNGYRLPTKDEWEMAARWRNSSGDGSISTGGRYWTPGNYASGANADCNSTTATNRVAWYSSNSKDKTHPVFE